MTSEQERAAALILLSEDRVLQKLAVTWPRVAAKRVAGSSSLNYEEWSRISGIPAALIRDRAPVLFENGLCTDDGKTHPDVLSYVIAELADAMKPTRPKGKRR